MKTFQDCVPADRVQALPDRPPFPERKHVFEEGDLNAVQFAIDAERALLLTGEPGCGKTQLAEAVATALGCPFHPKTVNARTEAQELFFSIDYVRRLGAIQGLVPGEKPEEGSLDLLAFTRPGPLWKAVDPASAQRCGLAGNIPAGERSAHRPPSVVLIDEIDKAEVDLPNALLEVLSLWKFDGPEEEEIHLPAGETQAPLVIVTSNAEKDLPAAFLRRCIHHHIAVPREGRSFVDYVLRRGRTCFDLGEEVLLAAAEDLEKDRRTAILERSALPGVAEYLDMLRVLQKRGSSDAKRLALLAQARPFLFGKHARREET